jgi:hypothetical protein
MTTHPLVTVCNQMLHLLTLLRKQGLGIDECDCVVQAIVLSQAIVLRRVRYAWPMYFKYLTSDMVAYKWHLAKKKFMKYKTLLK